LKEMAQHYILRDFLNYNSKHETICYYPGLQ
jgi:hypothetical protein